MTKLEAADTGAEDAEINLVHAEEDESGVKTKKEWVAGELT